ncbi:MAG: TIGR02444 family protein [Rhizobiales bacterium 65-9]|nr:TIGR02444 family protein [Hyphomicrobiales bacterium]OJY38895.1 MAG: TIGR02444 family protein [Rhizobiales bacterium 65-9]
MTAEGHGLEESGEGRAASDVSAEADLFWRFSLALYAKPGVKQACLALQDRLGVDVNVLFFCIWWPSGGKPRLDQEDFDGVLAEAAAWSRQVVVGLRTVRRALGSERAPAARLDGAALRKKVLAVELEAERLEQAMLVDAAIDRLSAHPSSEAGTPARTDEEIDRYFSWAGIQRRADDVRDLEAIVGQAIGDPSILQS